MNVRVYVYLPGKSFSNTEICKKLQKSDSAVLIQYEERICQCMHWPYEIFAACVISMKYTAR